MYIYTYEMAVVNPVTMKFGPLHFGVSAALREFEAWDAPKPPPGGGLEAGGRTRRILIYEEPDRPYLFRILAVFPRCFYLFVMFISLFMCVSCCLLLFFQCFPMCFQVSLGFLVFYWLF